MSQIITRNHIQDSMSTTQHVESHTTIHVTPILEKVIRRPEFIFVSPTRVTLTLEHLRKNTQEITSRVEKRTEEAKILRDALSLIRVAVNSPINTNTQNTTQQGETPEI